MANDLVGLRRVINTASGFLWRVAVQGDEVEEMAEVRRWLRSLEAALDAEEKKQNEGSNEAKS